MFAFGRLLLKTLNRRRCFSSFSLHNYTPICAGNFTNVDFSQESHLRPVSRRCRDHLRAPVWYDRPRRFCVLHKTQCNVHKFGELRLRVGSSCDVAVSSLNPRIYLDQNLVIVNDAASRLSVDYHNSDDVSHVAISESEDLVTSKESKQQSDVCNIEVPIKYGSLYISVLHQKITHNSA